MQTQELPLEIIDSGAVVNLKHAEVIEVLLKRFGEPFSDSSYLYSEELYSAVPKEYKVLIGGDGADEVFHGYKPVTFIFVACIITKVLPKFIRRFLLKNYQKYHKTGVILRSLLGCKDSLEKLIMGFSTRELHSLILTCKNQEVSDQNILKSSEISHTMKIFLTIA